MTVPQLLITKFNVCNGNKIVYENEVNVDNNNVNEDCDSNKDEDANENGNAIVSINAKKTS